MGGYPAGADTLPPALLPTFLGVLGLLVGSFLNVVVHRVPAGLSLVSPGSACPACAHPVRPRDNVPVVSWLVLRGHCRDCAVPISVRFSGSSIRVAMACAKAATSLPGTYMAASAADARFSRKSNATIGFESAIYSIILIMVECSV